MNNHLSPQIIEYKKITTYGFRHSSPGVKQHTKWFAFVWIRCYLKLK